ncbi:hypothetical protein ABDD95_03960 [Mucilaginibacter sp. PAMB04274]|uniref:hypothetical protein n=1 Tax=Mucilaginibacter sp. PAMB04274 TaxID=3138568 RepID=UPI0031F6166F
MEVTLVNLSNNLYEESRFRLNTSAQSFNINRIESYDFDDIKESSFFKDNESILSQPKGIGYWLWKPYIILEAFNKLAEDDIVIYCDAGLEVIADLQPLINICAHKEPILLFGNANQLNYEWTKRDCFVLMNCDESEYWHAPHCDAAFSLWRKNELSISFLNEWLKYGSDERIITDLPNTCGKENLPGFADHRWDQSILSLLAQKRKINLYRMPTQFGNHYKEHCYRISKEFLCVNQSKQGRIDYYHFLPYYNSPYGQLLNHHRSKKVLETPHTNISHATRKQASSIYKKLFRRTIKKLFRVLGYKLVKS